ncbi:sigma-70 family RNA polymerase sigma factor [Roseateles sp.]|uniref:sigma-70 family RNA polymerase sigma factor n=1 Tax=Roseateles sp. TaxID=1971397 RepID=UPI0025E510DC|nr:sigma-70 family RNA polymerase sigma factor [Roseateles sp.]MBV8035016.1 sigma-70 family RNA polymerase sigma factor [Roseateles sp.]
MTDRHRFEASVLPLLDAAHNLARWLLRDAAAAEDAVQEAALRAFRYFASLRPNEDARPWFLGIVRNACFTALARERGRADVTLLDEDAWDHLEAQSPSPAPDPLTALGMRREQRLVDAALRALSPPMREVIVLRELEGLDYRDIAQIAGIPIGTVMSRLSRARAQLKRQLSLAGLP